MKSREDTTLDSEELPTAEHDSLRGPHETATSRSSNYNASKHEPSDVDSKKFRNAAIRGAVVAFVLAAVTTLGLERSSQSSWWIIPTIAAILFFYAEHVRNIESAFVTEAQNAKTKTVIQGAAADGSLPFETAEWVNCIIEKLFPIVNTDLLLPVLDLLEDAMKDNFPHLIHAVRVEELDLGVNAIKLVRVKRLSADEPISEKHEPESDNTRHVNLEIDFAYDGRNSASASDNTHMIIYIATGIGKFATIELPTFIVLQSASGTIRVRAELISDPPFVRHTTISFPKMPGFTLSARPMKTINIMRFPLLSDFVHKSVAEVITSFIAPNAFTIDAARIIMGQDVDLNTESQGVAVVAIHSASGLSNTDHGSKSDPFIVVTWAKLGKTLYTTRVIRNELSPQWEEVAFIPVPPDALREGEKICLAMWDSDKLTADDSLGQVEVSINDLFDDVGRMKAFELPLTQAIRKANAKGTVKFSAGYFPAHELAKGSRKVVAGTTVKMKVGGSGAPLVEHEGEDAGRRSGHFADLIKETMDAKLPPSPKQNSGILAIQIHQLADLELPRKQRAVGSDDSRQDTQAPSTYVQVFLNDEMVLKTRLKRLTSSPYINARTENFCRDWTRTRVDIVILDYREREDDAVLGVISMRLADMFSSTSQVTAWRPLLGGIGTGRCRVSILFKPLDMYLPASLRGWNIGTILVDKIVCHNLPPSFRGFLSIRLSGGKYRTQTDLASTGDGNLTVWKCQPPLRVPVMRRHQRALQIRVSEMHHTLGRTKTVGEGILWLGNILDDTTSSVRVDLGPVDSRRKSNNDTGLLALPTSEQREDNSGKPDTHKTDGLQDGCPGEARPPQGDLTHLYLTLRFTRGLSSLHSSLIGDTADPSIFHSMRMREYAIEAGERKVGSAKFQHKDEDQKGARQRRVWQAREASLSAAQLQDADKDPPYRNKDEIHLGMLEQGPGGGLPETGPDLMQKNDFQGAAGDQEELEDEEDWEEDAGEGSGGEQTKKSGFARRKEDFRSDRIHERGIFQSKVGRTAKWIKDASSRRAQKVQRHFRHSEAIPNVPEEGVSRL